MGADFKEKFDNGLETQENLSRPAFNNHLIAALKS
jgi:hypothetical protein